MWEGEGSGGGTYARDGAVLAALGALSPDDRLALVRLVGRVEEHGEFGPRVLPRVLVPQLARLRLLNQAHHIPASENLLNRPPATTLPVSENQAALG